MPHTFENGRVVETHEDKMPAKKESTPLTIAKSLRFDVPSLSVHDDTVKGGFFLGWYYRNRNANALAAMRTHESMLALTVKMCEHVSTIVQYTSTEYLQASRDLAVARVEASLSDMKRKIALNDHQEELAVIARKRERYLAENRGKIEAFRKEYLEFEKSRSEIESDSTNSPEMKQVLLFQLAVLLDKTMIALDGAPLPKPEQAKQSPHSTPVNLKEQAEKMHARCEIEVTKIRNTPGLSETDKEEKIRITRIAYQDAIATFNME